MILHVIRREVREQVRQPALVGLMTFFYVVFAALIGFLLAVLELVHTQEATFLGQLEDAGFGVESLDVLTESVLYMANFTNATQLFVFTAILCGHAVLHDRQCGTLPFLLLAPLSRAQLLTAKVVGAMAIPVAIYLLVGGGMMAFAAALPVTVGAGDSLPMSGGWTICFFLATPIWTYVCGLVCAMVSSLSRDVRTAQTVASLVMGLFTATVGSLMTWAIPKGAVTQLVLVLFGVLAAAVALGVGSRLISRDLSR